jgi:hypothetical protein
MERGFPERRWLGVRWAWQPSLKLAQPPHDGQNKKKASMVASLVSFSIAFQM